MPSTHRNSSPSSVDHCATLRSLLPEKTNLPSADTASAVTIEEWSSIARTNCAVRAAEPCRREEAYQTTVDRPLPHGAVLAAGEEVLSARRHCQCGYAGRVRGHVPQQLRRKRRAVTLRVCERERRPALHLASLHPPDANGRVVRSRQQHGGVWRHRKGTHGASVARHCPRLGTLSL